MKGQKEGSSFLPFLLKLAGSALFLWLILRNLDLQAVIVQVLQVRLTVYLLLILLFLVSQLLKSYRWKILLEIMEVQESLGTLYRIFLYGQVLNIILPTSIGGDTARIAYLINKYPSKKSAGVSATLLDRVMGLFALVLIAVCALPFSRILGPDERLLIFLGLLLLIAVSVFLILGRFEPLVRWILGREFFPDRIGKLVERAWQVLQEFRGSPGGLSRAFLAALAIQMLENISQYGIFFAVGVLIPLPDVFVAIPLVNLISMIPISLGGVGLREISLVSLLAVENHLVVSYSLIRYSLIILLAGGLAVEFLFNRQRLSEVTKHIKRSPEN